MQSGEAVVSWVHIEPIVYVLRAGHIGDGFGDPYEFVATLIIRGNHAEAIGATGHFDIGWRLEVQRLLASIGVTELSFERRKASSNQKFPVSADARRKVTLVADTQRPKTRSDYVHEC